MKKSRLCRTKFVLCSDIIDLDFDETKLKMHFSSAWPRAMIQCWFYTFLRLVSQFSNCKGKKSAWIIYCLWSKERGKEEKRRQSKYTPCFNRFCLLQSQPNFPTMLVLLKAKRSSPSETLISLRQSKMFLTAFTCQRIILISLFHFFNFLVIHDERNEKVF